MIDCNFKPMAQHYGYTLRMGLIICQTHRKEVEYGGVVVEHQTLNLEVLGLIPALGAVLCP